MWAQLPVPTGRDSAEISRLYGKKARFLVDESLGIEVANLLRQLGFNTKFAGEVGLAGRSDETVLSYAWREDRILLTHDRDFLDDRRFPTHRNPGIVILPGAEGEQQPLIRALGQIISLIAPLREFYRRSKVVISTDGVFTLRKRDLVTGRVSSRRYRLQKRGLVLEWVE